MPKDKGGRVGRRGDTERGDAEKRRRGETETRGRRAKNSFPPLDINIYLCIFMIPGNNRGPVPRIAFRSGRLFDNSFDSVARGGISKRER